MALIKGAGDLATGVALRLYHSGFAVVMTELPQPTCVRRAVAFAEAVTRGRVQVEDVEAVRVDHVSDAEMAIRRRVIPVIVDPEAMTRDAIRPVLLVDAIVAKRNTGTKITDAHGVEALGPGFTAGSDVDAVIETKRGPTLGRVIWEGEALPDTGIPGEINGFSQERVLRAPCNGVFRPIRAIGDRVSSDEVVAYVDEAPIRSRLGGVVHGLLEPGMTVAAGFKVGDVDPRASREECFLVSDKALAVAGGVLEAACALLGGVSFRDWPPHPATDPQRP